MRGEGDFEGGNAGRRFGGRERREEGGVDGVVADEDTGAVGAIPGDAAGEEVGHGAGGIESTAEEDAGPGGVDASFEGFDDVAVDGVFGDDPAESDGRGDDVVDKASLGEVALDVADGCFREGAEFELLAVGGGEGGGAEAAFPVAGIAGEGEAAEGGIVLDPEEAGGCALHGVADVVDDEGVAIGPAVDAFDGLAPADKEGSFEAFASAWFGGEAEGVLDGGEEGGLFEEILPVGGGGFGGEGRLGGFDGRVRGGGEEGGEQEQDRDGFRHDFLTSYYKS